MSALTPSLENSQRGTSLVTKIVNRLSRFRCKGKTDGTRIRSGARGSSEHLLKISYREGVNFRSHANYLISLQNLTPKSVNSLSIIFTGEMV